MTNEEMTERLVEVDARSKSNSHRLDDIEKRQDDLDGLVASMAVFAKEQEHIQQDVKEIKNDVKALTDKPAKRWDIMMDKLIAAAVGAFLVWVATGLPGVK